MSDSAKAIKLTAERLARGKVRMSPSATAASWALCSWGATTRTCPAPSFLIWSGTVLLM